LTVLVTIALDSTSKIWIEQMLDPSQPISVAGEFLRLTLGYNSGVAFGMFANGGPWPLIVTGLVILFLFVWFAQGLRSGQFSPGAVWPIGLLLGGAIGNFIDRLLDGQVTDFLDVGIGAARWPTFNLADSFILIGVGLLLLLSFNTQLNGVSPEGEAETPA
jgi:signal peptidase II